MKWVKIIAKRAVIILYMASLVFMFLYPPCIHRHSGYSLIKYSLITNLLFDEDAENFSKDDHAFSVYTDLLVIQITIVTLFFIAFYLLFVNKKLPR